MESKRFHWYLIFLLNFIYIILILNENIFGNLNYILFEIINRVLGISNKFLYSLHSLQNFELHDRFPNKNKMPNIKKFGYTPISILVYLCSTAVKGRSLLVKHLLISTNICSIIFKMKM